MMPIDYAFTVYLLLPCIPLVAAIWDEVRG